jgi:hypothetical protein
MPFPRRAAAPGPTGAADGRRASGAAPQPGPQSGSDMALDRNGRPAVGSTRRVTPGTREPHQDLLRWLVGHPRSARSARHRNNNQGRLASEMPEQAEALHDCHCAEDARAHVA